jgi:hypothetical protein
MKTARAGVRGVGDHSLQAKQLRDRAEECRTLARMINAAYYLRLAESYDVLPTKRSGLRATSQSLKSNLSKDEALRIAVNIANRSFCPRRSRLIRMASHATTRRSGPRHALVLRIGSTRVAVPGPGSQALLKR